MVNNDSVKTILCQVSSGWSQTVFDTLYFRQRFNVDGNWLEIQVPTSEFFVPNQSSMRLVRGPILRRLRFQETFLLNQYEVNNV